MIGTTLGQYRVIGKLGEGGMGEVFRATDLKLQRAVAIKSLPLHFAADPDRVARFEREAQALAALAHPGIAGIYELLEHGDQRFLVLELVEGETLAARLRRGPVPVEEALPIARQIAEGLEAAHDKGIVHRDLKPANIALTPDGGVKLLDFGLAVYRAEGTHTKATADTANSPTFATMTAPGVILGTAAYMSPEQARGKAVDRRADIWAFGCVLFEMLTASPAFAGDTVSDVIGAVLRAEPDWQRLPAEVPPFVRRLLLRSLEKDPRRRLPHIGSARLDLEEGVDGFASDAAGQRSTASRRGWMALWCAVAALAIAVTALSARVFFQPAPQTIGLVRFNIEPPPGTFQQDANDAHFALSRDGRMVAFVRSNLADMRPALWVAALSSPDSRMLPGTDGAAYPFWSPDGREVAFFASGSLKKVSLADGALTTLCAANGARGGSWGAEGTILFAAGEESPIWLVPGSGGAPRAVTTPQTGKVAHSWPYWTGEGDSFLYTAREPTGRSAARLRWVSSGDDREILESQWRVTYSDGQLFSVRRPGGTAAGRGEELYAQPFDVRSGTVRGQPRLIAERVAVATGNAAFDTSGAGVLVFRNAMAFNQPSRLVWRSRQGGDEIAIDGPRPFYRVALSPDGTRAIAQIHADDATSGTADLWIYDLTRAGVRSRFASNPETEQSPTWSHDGRYVAYTSSPFLLSGPGEADLWIKDSGGVEPGRLVAKGAGVLRGWAPDGKAVVTTRNADLWLVPIDGSSPRPLIQGPYGEYDARFSPDGRWLAYTTNENGRWDIFVQPYPFTGQRWSVTPSGGHEPVWSGDSRELYFCSVPERGAPEHLMAVSVLSGDMPFGTPRRILTSAIASLRFTGRYAVSPDGSRFLLISPVDADLLNREMPITVVVDWQALVQDR